MFKNAIQRLREERDTGRDYQASSIQNIKGSPFLTILRLTVTALKTSVINKSLGEHNLEAV